MAKDYKGQLHIRVPPALHEDIAREAFEQGISISSLCSQALLIRQALRKLDPWSSITQTWEANASTDLEEMQSDINEAISAVRRNSKGER